MRPPEVITAPVAKEASRAKAPAPDFAWSLMSWVGLALVIVGGQDLVLALIPLRIGNPEWEFGTVTAMLNGMPAMTMGLALVLGGAAARGIRWLMRVAAVLLFVLAAAILAGFTLYALTIPIALSASNNPVIVLGLKKAIARTAVQAVVYPFTFVVMGIAAIRHAARSS